MVQVKCTKTLSTSNVAGNYHFKTAFILYSMHFSSLSTRPEKKQSCLRLLDRSSFWLYHKVSTNKIQVRKYLRTKGMSRKRKGKKKYAPHLYHFFSSNWKKSYFFLAFWEKVIKYIKNEHNTLRHLSNSRLNRTVLNLAMKPTRSFLLLKIII